MHGLVVPSDLPCLQKVSKYALVDLDSKEGDKVSFVELKMTYDANKAQLNASVKAPDGTLSEVKHRVHDLEPNKDTVDNLTVKVNKTERALKTSEKHVMYLGHLALEQPNQPCSKDTEATNHREQA